MKLTIIGAGPGGYETAVAAAARGIEVNIVSCGPVGGTCLNEGCIPTKALCRNAEVLEDIRNAGKFGIGTGPVTFDIVGAMARKDEVVGQLRGGIEFLLKNKLIHLVYGKASFKDAHTVTVSAEDGSETELVSDFIIIATGAKPAMLPVPGNDLDGVITSREILRIDHVPERLCIIGAGVIGLEFASVFRSFGSEVTVLEYCRDILPRFDTDMAKRLKQALGKRGISIETSAQVQRIDRDADGLRVMFMKKDNECSVVADNVLMAVGRRPAVDTLNLGDVGIEFSSKGIVTDANMRTNVPHIFAIGDVRGGMMLAHVASAEGERALDVICEESSGGVTECPVADGIDLNIIPAAVFTSPEVGTVGMTEDSCKEAGIPVKCLKSMYRANGKALAMDEPEGFCKIVVAAGDGSGYDSGQILGCHIFGAHASDIIQEITVLMNRRGTVDDIRKTVHPHPTLSEVILNAARQGL